MPKILVICLDLEGVLVPEIWINVAKRSGIPELKLTTRDIPDYDVLMKRRIRILKEKNIKLSYIQKVISQIKPLPGARKFLDELRSKAQVIILSDTFEQFSGPLMKQLGWPTIFCNTLITDKKGFISGYTLRQKDGKKKAVNALRSIGFEVRAAGDSYNDITMLKNAHRGVLFNAPANIKKEFPRFKTTRNYSELRKALLA